MFVTYILFYIYAHVFLMLVRFGNSELYTLIFHDSKFSVEIHIYVCIYVYFDTELLYKEFITN